MHHTGEDRAQPSPLAGAGGSIARSSSNSSLPHGGDGSENAVRVNSTSAEIGGLSAADFLESDAAMARALAESLGGVPAQGQAYTDTGDPEVRVADSTRRERLIDDEADWDMDMGMVSPRIFKYLRLSHLHCIVGQGSIQDTLNRLQSEIAQSRGFGASPEAMLQASSVSIFCFQQNSSQHSCSLCFPCAGYRSDSPRNPKPLGSFGKCTWRQWCGCES